VTDYDRARDAGNRVTASLNFKKWCIGAGIDGCEICGWSLPCDLPHSRVTKSKPLPGLDAHHIVPRSLGGTHDYTNLVLLCPNCHRIAHGLFGRPHATSRWFIDLSREEFLIKMLAAVQRQTYPEVGESVDSAEMGLIANSIPDLPTAAAEHKVDFKTRRREVWDDEFSKAVNFFPFAWALER
jgi:hypothetical protein